MLEVSPEINPWNPRGKRRNCELTELPSLLLVYFSTSRNAVEVEILEEDRFCIATCFGASVLRVAGAILVKQAIAKKIIVP